jgi:FMN phosphatase YigB (HAD superfamily)
MLDSKYACVIDKDNTLLDNNKIYSDAQAEGLKVLSREIPSLNPYSKESFSIQRTIDKKIVDKLKVFRYNLNIYALALYLNFSERARSMDEAVEAAINWKETYPSIVEEIAEVVDRGLKEMPKPFPYTYEVLEYLQPRAFMIMFSAGSPKKQIPTIEQNKLEQYFDSIVVVPRKTPKDVERVKELAIQHSKGENSIWMFDDLLEQLSYAINLEMHTVWMNINSDFENADIFGGRLEDLPKRPDFIATSMPQLLEYLKTQIA